MGSKYRIFFITLSLFAHLYLFTSAQAEPARINNHAPAQETFLSVSVPEKDRLSLVSVLPIVVEGVIVGRLAAYDDATTERPADLLELYSRTGDLLAFSWFDRFGIQRAAVDRGLLEEADELEGIFVPLLEGDLI